MARVTVKAQAVAPVQQKRAALLEQLKRAGRVDEAAVARAQLVAARTQQPVEQVLNQLGSLSDEHLVSAYAETADCEIWRPDVLPPCHEVPPELGISSDYLRSAGLLPLVAPGDELLFASADPLDDEALAGVAFATGRTVRVLAARPADFRRASAVLFDAGLEPHLQGDTQRLEREVDLVSDASSDGGGARLVAAVFEAAIAAGASDIHFEPRRHEMRVRLRVDGRLLDHRSVSADLAGPAVSRVKVIANLDLGERRLPQDGRTTFVVQGRPIDVRVATSPTVFGEAAVLRILDRTAVALDLTAMGLSELITATLTQAARAPHGLFLVTGPTGSGKTTTLYALLQTFSGSDRKVLSVEDPVEYHFEHVTQTQVAPQLGLTFAATLRSFLRQDPDVILVGEIRDPETAAVAIQAAMTGHFVLASVHANNALAVLPRLQDMGIEPYQLAAALRGVVAQRLVRRLCPDCRALQPAGRPSKLRALGVDAPKGTPHDAVGCPKCQHVGFRGRVPIAEGFLADEELLRAVAQRHAAQEVANLARRAGLGSMLLDGLTKVEQGLTTEDEVLAAIDV